MEEKTDDSLIFVWKPVEHEIEITNENGEIVEWKGKHLKLLSSNYLFNYYGEWYEVLDYQQLNYNLIAVEARRSIFYNDYWTLIQSQVNGILHHSPLAKKEICSCPDYDNADLFWDFISSYKLDLCLYKTRISGAGQNIFYSGKTEKEPDRLPTIHGISLVRVGKTLKEIEKEVKSVKWDKFWNDCWNSLSGISIAGFSLGQGQNELGVMYYLLNDRMSTEQNYFSEHQDEKNEWLEALEEDGKVKNELDAGKGINKRLHKLGLTNEEGEPNPFMSHFLYWHVKGTLFWRKKQFWEGRYWMLHKHGVKVNEVCNASGNTITIFAYGLVIARFTENITAKLGLSPNGAGLLNVAVDVSLQDERGQNLRQAERTVVSDSKNKDGKETHTESRTITRTPVSNSGNKPKIKIPSVQPLLFGTDHTKSEYTFLQFESRWKISAQYPLSLRIQLNSNLLNQYRHRREIKGPMAYDYFNVKEFGAEILNKEGLLKASIISWNMTRNGNWFREKIENQVYLYKNSFEEFYLKKISGLQNPASKGANIRGQINLSSISKTLRILPGIDDQTGIDGLSWVFKDSFCRKEDGTGDVFPQLINDGRAHIRIDNDTHNSRSGCPRTCLKGGFPHQGSWRFDADATWSSQEIILEKNKLYYYTFHTFSKSANHTFTPIDTNSRVSLHQMGNRWELKTIGEFKHYKLPGDPDGVPSEKNTPDELLQPFGGNPNNPTYGQRSSFGSIVSTPTGSGEFEPSVPDIDVSPDPDFDQGLDFDPSQDPESDPTKDPDKTIEIEIPPDGPEKSDDDND